MKRRVNKMLFVPSITTILIVLSLVVGNIFAIQIEPKHILFLLALFILTIVIVEIDRHRHKSILNANYLRNMNDDIYGYYKKVTRDFTYVDDVDREPFQAMSRMDAVRMEEFIVMLVQNEKLFFLNKNNFEQLNKTDGMYYQLFYIYTMYYLLENDIDKFVLNYKHFKNTIYTRTEFRVLHEKLENIRFGRDTYEIPVELLEVMYEYYEKGLAIDKEILRYQPRCKLDEMFYVSILYHYYEATENHKMVEEMEDQYMKYKQIRRNL